MTIVSVERFEDNIQASLEAYFARVLQTDLIDPDVGEFEIKFQLEEAKRGWYRIAIIGRWLPADTRNWSETVVEKKCRISKERNPADKSRKAKRPIDENRLTNEVAELGKRALEKFLQNPPFKASPRE